MSIVRRPNRFLDRRKSRRLVAFTASRFPLPALEPVYRIVHRLALRLDADFRVVYADPNDPATLDPDAKAWLGQGMPCAPSPLQEESDLAHFRHVAGTRLEAALQQYAAAMRTDVATALATRPLRIGCVAARLVQGYAPDIVVSTFCDEEALHAWLTCALLDLPRLLWLEALPTTERFGALLPLHLAQAACVVTPHAAVADALRAQLPDSAADKVLCLADRDDWELELARRLADVVRKRTPAIARTDLGPARAFRTRTLAPLAHGGTQPFVVLGAERTGSNLLVDLLAQHDAVFAAGELFNPRLIDEDALDLRDAPLGDHAELCSLRRRDPAQFLQRVLQSAAAHGARAAGCKLLHYHAIADGRVVDALHALPDLRLVHLVREDRLARWVSQVRAEARDTWWAAADADARPGTLPPLPFDPRDTLRALEASELFEERALATFAGVPTLQLAYEELAADPSAGAERVQRFLGLAPCKTQPRTRKTGDEDPRRGIANWPELLAAFRDTRWEDAFVRHEYAV